MKDHNDDYNRAWTFTPTANINNYYYDMFIWIALLLFGLFFLKG